LIKLNFPDDEFDQSSMDQRVVARYPAPSSVWGDVDLTGYVGCRDGVTVGFEMNSQTGGEGLGF
jgi:hypothetical protein